jgi:putative peptide zinc metalloprotease protein
MWHVVQDQTANQFLRLSETAYPLVAMLDGRRTVAEVWRICNEQLGDSAPTQGEAIELLGQLYASNMLQANLPPDAESLFKRYQRRRLREVQGFLMNLLFVRIPLIDPDNFLERWVGIVGRVFSWYGLGALIVLLAGGFYAVAGRVGELVDRAQGILDPANLPLLYLTVVVVKVFHEFAHAFACKRFGTLGGVGGEVHVMGVMFLVFAPFPYMDASSVWAFRSKWHRTIVGAAGMLAELAIASVAAMIWANTAEGTSLHAIAYNVIFLASVSSLLFNGNPLLRFDGYYILSDLLEIPNLAQRSRDYLQYLVKKHVWGVRNPRNPAASRGERIWFVGYGISSTIYRVYISLRILLFVADKLFLLGAALAVAGAISFVFVPLARFVRYLATSGELLRVRNRAIGTTLAALAVVIAAIGLIPAPDRFRVEGVVEPVALSIVHAGADGFVEDFLPSGTEVRPGGPPLVRSVNPQLQAQAAQLRAERRRVEAMRRLAQTRNVALAQAYAEQIGALDERIARAEEELSALTLRAPVAGQWVSPDIEKFAGAYVRRGDRLGLLAGLEAVIVRAMVGQRVAPTIVEEAGGGQNAPLVDIRVRGRPDMELSGRVEKVLAAGQEQLPSAALGYPAGGSIQTAVDDPRGTRAAEQVFEIRIGPDPHSSVRLLPGQRVVVRFHAHAKPLAAQWWRELLQLIQRRFHA